MTEASDISYAPANTSDGVFVGGSAPQRNALAAIRELTAYLIDLNLPSAQTADAIADSLVADASAMATIQAKLDLLADAFQEVSNMFIPATFQDASDWVTAAAGSPTDALTEVSASDVAVSSSFGPEWQQDTITAAATVYQRAAFRPRNGRTYRVTIRGYAEASNACTLSAIVAQLNSSYVVTTANKAASQTTGFSAANTEQTVTFTMSVDQTADVDLDAVDFVRVGASIGPDAATATNCRITEIRVHDVTNEDTPSANIDHDATTNFVVNEHVDHSGVEITAGAGLTGGGAITATRTLDVGAGTGITVNTDDIQIADGGVGTTQLANEAVTAPILGTGSVTAAKIGAGAIGSEHVGAFSWGAGLPITLDYADTARWVPDSLANITVRARSYDTMTAKFSTESVVEFAGSASDSDQTLVLQSGYYIDVADSIEYLMLFEAARSGSVADIFVVIVDFYDSSDVYISSRNVNLSPSDLSDGVVTLSALQFTAVATASSMRIRVRRSGSDTTGTWYFGALFVRPVNAVTSAEISAGTETAIREWSPADFKTAVETYAPQKIAPDVIIEDQKAQNTAGGTFTSGAWQTRDLNTIVRNNISMGALSSNEFTLSAGTYYFEISAPGHRVDDHRVRLYNVTDSSEELLGGNASATDSNDTATHSFACGVVTIASSKAFRVEHQCFSTRSTDGFGEQSNFTGAVEVYTNVKIWDMS